MRSSATLLEQTGGILYLVATEEHGDAMTRLLADRFAHEPMGRALGLTAAELYDFASRFIPDCTANRLSVVAVPEESPDKLAGLVINRDFTAPLPAGVPDEFPRWAPIIAVVGIIDEQYEAQVGGFRTGQAVDLWMVAVHPGFSRRGLARQLFRLSARLAYDQGFERCVTECTGHYSQRAAVEAGFEERACLFYRDFLFEGQPVFASIPEPHVKVALYEKVLASHAAG